MYRKAGMIKGPISGKNLNINSGHDKEKLKRKMGKALPMADEGKRGNPFTH